MRFGYWVYTSIVLKFSVPVGVGLSSLNTHVLYLSFITSFIKYFVYPFVTNHNLPFHDLRYFMPNCEKIPDIFSIISTQSLTL